MSRRTKRMERVYHIAEELEDSLGLLEHRIGIETARIAASEIEVDDLPEA